MADSAEGPPAECQCTVVPVPVSFSRNDRQIGGRIGHLLGPGALAFALAHNSGMETRRAGPRARLPVTVRRRRQALRYQVSYLSSIPILKTYPILSYLSCYLSLLPILFYPNYPVT